MTRGYGQFAVVRYAWMVALGAFFSLATQAGASTVSSQAIQGDGPLGHFTGSLTYTYAGGASATLSIYLKNVSPPDNGGYLTSFLFNVPDDVQATLTPTPTANFIDIGGPLDAGPYGTFEAGAGIPKKKGNTWVVDFNGAGDPKKGIAVGEDETFLFQVTGPDLNALNALNFLTERSPGKGNNGYNEFFITRFMGFDDGGSNMTPGTLIPLPPAAWGGLMLLGALTVGGIRRRWQQA